MGAPVTFVGPDEGALLVAVWAEANIARGRRCIERMQHSVMEQKLKGHDAKEAEKLVAHFEEIQIAHVQAAKQLLKAMRGLSH